MLIIIIVEIKSNHRVNNAFYIISFCLGVVDLFNLINSVVFYSFPRWGFFRVTYVMLGQFILKSGFFVSWGLGLSQVSFLLF